MYIESFSYRGWRGAGFKFKFTKGVNVLVGMNGCGKTNSAELLAILVGHKDAHKLLREDDQLKYAKIVVGEDVGPSATQRYVLELKDGIDLEKINAFKDCLPTLTSFVLQQDDLRDDRFVTARREPVECQKDMLEWLRAHDLDLRLYVKDGEYATLLVSETGAQRYLMTVGMRRAPSATPMIVEHPERSLHIMLRRRIADYYRESNDQQVILTTHDPEVLSMVDSARWGTYHDCAIDMSDKKIRW
jgi:hypothetical protein